MRTYTYYPQYIRCMVDTFYLEGIGLEGLYPYLRYGPEAHTHTFGYGPEAHTHTLGIHNAPKDHTYPSDTISSL